MMNVFKKYKDEIKESIKSISEKQEETNDLLIEIKDIYQEQQVDSEVDPLEEDTEEKENESEVYEEDQEDELIDLLIDQHHELMELVDSNNETLVAVLEETNKANVEGYWLVTIVLVLAIGFRIFFDNILKW